jgi:hypothetical protein
MRIHLAGWVGLLVVAFANGTLREFTYGRHIAELHAHQLSTLTGMLLSGAVALGLARRWPLASARQAWAVGAVWLLLTVLFEFGFGHYVAGHPWPRLLHDYDLAAGRLWALFLAWLALLPYLGFRAGR